MATASERHDTRHTLRNDGVLANAAMLYYKEGLTQNEIALRMGVSRATVVNYLRLAREMNIVDIRVNGTSFSTSNLSKELRDKFALKDIYIADYSPPDDTAGNHASLVNQHVARVGAMALHDIVQPGEVLGVAWGETIHFLAEEVPRQKIDNLTVCQMIGSMKSPLISTAESCAIRISSRFGADCYTLHAPAVLTTPELAEALRNEPIIKSQLARFDEFDRTVFSVGNCDANTHIVQTAIASKADFDWYKSQGAVGVLCGRFIDVDGNHIEGSMDDRMIGITLAELRRKASGTLVAGGPSKLRAIQATLAGGYVSHLVIDNETAQQLMAR